MLLLVSTLMLLSTRFLIVDTAYQNKITADLTRGIHQGAKNMILSVTARNDSSFCDNSNVTLSKIKSQVCSGTTNSCPTWFICNDTDSEIGKCQCGPHALSQWNYMC